MNHGQFDGFPTGAVIHASLSGCLMMVTDSFDNAPELGLKDCDDLIIISDRVSEITEKLRWISNNRPQAQKIAANGKAKLAEYFSDEYQLSQRLEIIERTLTSL